MAKELPYFKFEPSEWESGNIQMCSNEDKGLFMNICALYWSRLGDLSERLVVHRLCGGNALALNSLYDENIIALQDGKVVVKFLDDQMQEFDVVSRKNSDNAKIGWNKRRQTAENTDKNATALPTKSEGNARREEKRREEKRREEKSLKKQKPEIVIDPTPLFNWLNENCPAVQKMSNPISNDNTKFLTEFYDKKAIREVFEAMENYTGLHKKYKNAFLTFKSWLKVRQKDNPNYGLLTVADTVLTEEQKKQQMLAKYVGVETKDIVGPDKLLVHLYRDLEKNKAL